MHPIMQGFTPKRFWIPLAPWAEKFSVRECLRNPAYNDDCPYNILRCTGAGTRTRTERQTAHGFHLTTLFFTADFQNTCIALALTSKLSRERSCFFQYTLYLVFPPMTIDAISGTCMNLTTTESARNNLLAKLSRCQFFSRSRRLPAWQRVCPTGQ